MNRVPRQWEVTLCICVTVVSLNPASFDYFLVKKSIAAFTIVWRQQKESAYALQMLSGMVSLQFFFWKFDNCLNHQFGRPILHITPMDVAGRVPPSRLCQFVKPHQLLRNTIHGVLYHFGDCSHRLAGFIIFTQLAKLSIFFVTFLVFHVLLIV